MKYFNLHRSRKENQDNAIMYILMSSHKNLKLQIQSKEIESIFLYPSFHTLFALCRDS